MFTRAFYSPCEGCVYLLRDAQVFHAFPCRQSNSFGCSLCMDTATAPSHLGAHAWPWTYTVCIRGNAFALARLSNWEQWLHLCSCCIPIEINGAVCSEMHEMPVWANLAFVWAYAIVHASEWDLCLFLKFSLHHTWLISLQREENSAHM